MKKEIRSWSWKDAFTIIWVNEIVHCPGETAYDHKHIQHDVAHFTRQISSNARLKNKLVNKTTLKYCIN